MESFFVVAGYLDRVVLLVAMILVIFRQLQAGCRSPIVAPAMSALTALYRAKGRRPVLAFVWAAMLMLAADLAVSSGSTLGQFFGTRVKWGSRS